MGKKIFPYHYGPLLHQKIAADQELGAKRKNMHGIWRTSIVETVYRYSYRNSIFQGGIYEYKNKND